MADLAGQAEFTGSNADLDAAGNKDREKDLLGFAERLEIKRIEMVRMLPIHRESVRIALAGVNTQLAAGLFSSPVAELVQQQLEPVISRLSIRIRHWQLGADNDYSFIGYPETDIRIQEIRKLFSRFGSRMQFAIGWDWLPRFRQKNRPWDVAVLSAAPPLTSAEQKTSLQRSSKSAVLTLDDDRDHRQNKAFPYRLRPTI